MANFSFNLRKIGGSLTAPLVVVMPIYNEEANIAGVVSQWSDCLRGLGIPFQMVALDDGSWDGTHEILLQLESANPEMLCVVSKPNSGHGSTCRNGYDIAVNSAADWMLQIDSDGQCDPKHFADFWSRRENHDCVFGLRTSRDDGIARVVTSAICRLASSLICGQDLRDPNVPYRLIRREALQKALRYIPANFNIHNVALTYVLKKLPGLRWDYVPIHFPDRQAGENSLNVLKVVTWGAEMLLELLRIRVPAAPPA
ncbi:MAG: glycosyltransferase family 2 protein [Chthoniobacterales bacterium]